jgi:hypothetical protein
MKHDTQCEMLGGYHGCKCELRECLQRHDYGEPWTPAFRNSARTASGYDHGFLDTFQKRAIACVNACAGMADPAAEIAAMREAIREADGALKELRNFYLDCTGLPACAANAALTKLQPFITP